MAGTTRSWVCWATLAVALCAGCKNEEPPAEKPKEAQTEQKPVVDDKIASAVQAAAEAEALQSPGQQAGAPPPDGILGPDGAERELPAGKPGELVIGSLGGSPKLSLAPGEPSAGAGPKGTLRVSYRLGGSVLPTVSFDFESARTILDEADRVRTRFSLPKAAPAADQPGRLPANAAAEIAKLDGSHIELTTTKSGLPVAASQGVKGDHPDLAMLVESASTVLALVALPRPSEPVGPGAFWMVKARETYGGAEVVAYRMVKVDQVNGDVAELSVSTRRYLATPKLVVPGLPPHTVREFQGEGSANVSLRQGAAYPHVGRSRDGLLALIAPDDQPGQIMPLQADLSAAFELQQ